MPKLYVMVWPKKYSYHTAWWEVRAFSPELTEGSEDNCLILITIHLQQRGLVILEARPSNKTPTECSRVQTRRRKGNGGSSILTAHRCKSSLKRQGQRSNFSLFPHFLPNMFPFLWAVYYQLHLFIPCKRWHQTQVCDPPWSSMHKDD